MFIRHPHCWVPHWCGPKAECTCLCSRVRVLTAGEWRNFTLLPSWPEKDAQLYLVAFTLTVLQVRVGRNGSPFYALVTPLCSSALMCRPSAFL